MRRIWIAIVRLLGWKFHLPDAGSRPEIRRCVFVVAPHTAIADFTIGAAYLWSLDVNGHIFIKKEFFRWPVKNAMLRNGCIPIDRGNRHNGMVDLAVREFAKGETFTIAITPEATRKPVKRWKRGFWEIAKQAGVPIVPACIDFSKKEDSGKYICSVCGYLYDPAEHDGVAFEDLPDDWRCPRCKQPKTKFNKA